jgi:hypothetical protein
MLFIYNILSANESEVNEASKKTVTCYTIYYNAHNGVRYNNQIETP